jgi:hypothetical protein
LQIQKLASLMPPSTVNGLDRVWGWKAEWSDLLHQYSTFHQRCIHLLSKHHVSSGSCKTKKTKSGVCGSAHLSSLFLSRNQCTKKLSSWRSILRSN